MRYCSIFIYFLLMSIHILDIVLAELDSRIIGGSPGVIEDAKHIVSIRLKEYEKLKGFGQGHICGGSIIGPSTILTAAHCFFNTANLNNIKKFEAKDFVVVMGSIYRLKNTSDTLQYNVKELRSHEHYRMGERLSFDIGIIKIDGIIPENHNVVKSIPIANRNFKEGQRCGVYGWGSTTQYIMTPAEVLMTLNTEIAKQTICAKRYSLVWAKGMLCAVGSWNGGKDICFGDSGGPLICDDKLVGIVSWTWEGKNGCALRNNAGVYTNVYEYSDWIEKNSVNSSTNSLMLILVNLSLVLFLKMLKEGILKI